MSMGMLRTDVKPDGAFQLPEVVPDTYDVVVGGPRDVYLKSVRIGDQESKDRRVDVAGVMGPLTLLLGADVGQVDGSVKNAKGDPVVRARVTLIGYGEHLGRIDLSRFAFTDEKGEFKIKNVAPGDYKIFAWEDVPVGAPQDPEYRKPFEKQAVAVRMRPNGHENVEVTSIAAAETKSEDQ